jgi:SAM-dependent methyltransferase
MPLPQFPHDKSIVGLGMSDRPAYAKTLAERLSFTNTFFHQEPFFDITASLGSRAGTCDFVISSEVFEHVAPPVERAFLGAFNLLKPGGHLILTTPFVNAPHTVEHFPDLHDYRVLRFDEHAVVVNRTREGQYAVHENPRFHGIERPSLEMRIFGRDALLKCLADAGFIDVHVLGENVPEWGIVHKQSLSLPILATRPQLAADTIQDDVASV